MIASLSEDVGGVEPATIRWKGRLCWCSILFLVKK
jgi:hypothetical protein